MPGPEAVSIDVSDITLVDRERRPVRLAELPEVNVLVLMRHRH